MSEEGNVETKETKTECNNDDTDLLVNDDELDALLDDALKDFEKKSDKVELKPNDDNDKEKGEVAGSKNAANSPDILDNDQLFELTNNLTDVLEKMVMDEPSLKAQFDSFQQKMESSSAAFDDCPDLFDVDEDMAKKLEELTKNLGEDGGEFESMLKQMQSGMDGAPEDFGSDGDGFMAMMKGMMQNLLSKDLLYPSLKEIKDKYPAWLEENKTKISSEEYEKYSKQKTIVTQICELFDDEKEHDSDSVKNERMAKIVTLMEQMQEYGHPPSDMMENVVCGTHGEATPSPAECNVM